MENNFTFSINEIVIFWEKIKLNQVGVKLFLEFFHLSGDPLEYFYIYPGVFGLINLLQTS